MPDALSLVFPQCPQSPVVPHWHYSQVEYRSPVTSLAINVLMIKYTFLITLNVQHWHLFKTILYLMLCRESTHEFFSVEVSEYIHFSWPDSIWSRHSFLFCLRRNISHYFCIVSSIYYLVNVAHIFWCIEYLSWHGSSEKFLVE